MVKVVKTGALPQETLNQIDCNGNIGGLFKPADLSEAEREGIEAFKQWKKNANNKRRLEALRNNAGEV